MNQSAYLDILNPEQLQAVIHEGSPLLILAGAGSGKTRVITTKIAYLIAEKGLNPRSILAVTFTKKAANEMQERACRLEDRAQFVQIRTFHSFGSYFLRIYAELAELSSSFTVYDDTDSVSLILKAVPELTRVQAAQAAHKIARAKDYCLTPEDDLSSIDTDPNFAEIYHKYQTRLRETGNVDFGDLILLPLQILQKHEQVRVQMHNRFKVIMVDEYQDSNIAQFELLQALSGKETYVCVVGDDDQSIYRFRGAEVKNILTFQEHFANTALIRLERNYRSIEPILRTAGQVVECNLGRLGKTLRAERGGGKIPTLVFLTNQDEETAFCADLIKSAYKKGCPYSDWAILYRTNAQSLGFETEFLQRKIPYKVVGSLKFYNREEIKDALSYLSLIVNPRDEINFSRIINKPPRGLGAVTQEKIIAERRRLSNDELQKQDDVNSLLANDKSSSLLNKHDGYLDACLHIAPSLAKKAQTGLKDFISIMKNLIEELDAVLPEVKNLEGYTTENLAFDALNQTKLSKKIPENSLASFIEKVVQSAGLEDFHQAQDEIAGTQRVNNLQELVSSASLYPKNRDGLLQFLDHIELDRSAGEEDENIDAVTLITLHNTKGLEFPRVIITGIEKGIFPREDKALEELEEERRLFYVGITRAKDELYLTTCGIRRLYGRTAFMEPSPFLSELELEKLDIIGKKPHSFGRRYGAEKTVVYGNQTAVQKNDPLAARWKIGTQIFHDDFGYGVIAQAHYDDAEFIITVAFAGGLKKRFLPQYQASQLMIVTPE